jgi:hypothetical protein
VANTNDSFIDEVAEAVRRDRINLWFRRWGWLIAVAVLAIVGTAALLEWRESQAEATAEFRGEAILTSLEIEEPEERLAALSELPVTGEEGVVAAFLLAAEQQQAGDPAAAVRTLEAVAQDAEVPRLYRDSRRLKALMIQARGRPGRSRPWPPPRTSWLLAPSSSPSSTSRPTARTRRRRAPGHPLRGRGLQPQRGRSGPPHASAPPRAGRPRPRVPHRPGMRPMRARPFPPLAACPRRLRPART